VLWPIVRFLALERRVSVQDMHPRFDRCWRCTRAGVEWVQPEKIDQATVLKELKKLKIEQSKLF
jgi:hypothetical protein